MTSAGTSGLTAAERGSADSGRRAPALAARLRHNLNEGVLAFPLTPFTSAGQLNLDAFREHVRWQLAAGPAALFPCCGTGEFFSLAEEEYARLVRAAVEETAGDVPVLAGVGYGWAQAARFAGLAEEAGADGVLVLPHYLVDAPQPGLVQHVRELATRTPLPLLLYQRGNVKYTARSLAEIAALPTVFGLKDGHSDFDQLQRMMLAVPADFLFVNGSATAEMQLRAYAGIGMPAYSSSVHSFAPEIATAFFRAFHSGDGELVRRLLSSFYWPLVELRDTRAGYAISLVKAAARLRGEAVGPARAPITDPDDQDLVMLEKIVRSGLDCVGAEFAAARPDPAAWRHEEHAARDRPAVYGGWRQS
jgi:5-dehydro-4-deoxyglucarate dehydratase